MELLPQHLVSPFETGQEERCLSLLSEADRADPDAPADPLYGCQWHLNNTGQFGGDTMHDINVEEVWETTKGEGVNVAVVDTGLDYEHDDLKENVDTALNHAFHSGDVRDLAGSGHGTSVAGIIAARDNNLGGRGVAPRATIYGYRILGGFLTDDERAEAMTFQLDETDISNNSWGFADSGNMHFTNEVWELALKRGVEEGAGGKGTFYTWAAGNGGLGDNANLSERTNHYAVTAVCAVNYNDVRTHYSETGANLWICAPSSGVDPLPGITTTRIRNQSTSEFGGTSAAAPIVAGVAALMRSVNPDLTWRDLKLILAGSARKNDSDDSGWEQDSRRPPH